MNLEKAKENRKNFLAPYREKFEKAKTSKAKARIISELIEIEPSHLSEPWIIKQVILWLRDREYVYFIEDIFIKAPKKNVGTEDQKRRWTRDSILMDDIDKIIEETGVSVREACRVLLRRISESDERYYLLWDTTNGNQDLEKAIKQVYDNAKKKLAAVYPPWPYSGRDVEVDESGKIIIFGGR